MHGDLCKHLGIDSSNDHTDRYSNLFLNAYINRHLLAEYLKTYAAISNAQLFRVCKRGKLSGSCLSTLNGFGSIQLPIFLCHIGVPTFSSQNN